MTESNEPTNAHPDPIQLPAQDPAPAPTASNAGSDAPKRSNGKLLAGIAGAAALIAVAGVSGYAIGNAADHGHRGDDAGVSHFEANGAPGSQDGMRGGPDGMQGGDRDGRFGGPDGDRRGHGHHDGGGGRDMPGHDFDGPGMPNPDGDGPAPEAPALPSPPAPATPNS